MANYFRPSDEQEELWDKLLTKIAKATCRDFPDSDWEDIFQSLWLHLCEAWSKGVLLDPETKLAESEMWFAAKSAAWKERTEHLVVTPQYSYRTKDIRQLLETFFDRESWMEAQVPEDAVSELGNVALEMSADLSRAYDRLSKDYKTLIVRHFGLKEKLDAPTKKRLSKAVARMAEILNTYGGVTHVGGPGARRTLSNSHANHIISNPYEG
jgi:hypothetical protein